jgi:hypothetical protein
MNSGRQAAVGDHGIGRGAEQLLLWLVACLAGLPEAALAGLGLSGVELDAFQARFGSELDDMRLLRQTGLHMTRRRLAELLRARVSSMSLTASTPAELASVARTVKTLPDWVWDDAVVAVDNGVQPEQATITRTADGAVFASWEGGSAPSSALLDSVFGPALNRAERRRREALERKGK